MKQLLILALGAALAGGACGTTASDATDTQLPSARVAAAGAATNPVEPGYREVTIPNGTTLPLTLTNSISSDTSYVEDAVKAELTSPITIDGRDVLPTGARFTGVVTGVEDSGRVQGRAMIAFRFTSLLTGDMRYDVHSESLSHTAAATKGEDAAKIGAGTETGVVLATKGNEVRLRPGADVTTRLTAPLTVRVSRN